MIAANRKSPPTLRVDIAEFAPVTVSPGIKVTVAPLTPFPVDASTTVPCIAPGVDIPEPDSAPADGEGRHAASDNNASGMNTRMEMAPWRGPDAP